MKNPFLKEIEMIGKKGFTDQTLITTFTNRIIQGRIVKQESLIDHVCTFFVPVHILTRSLFLVDHIKAGTWIPPGGHIEPGEKPRQTVIREFREELDCKITEKSIHPFTLSLSLIENTKHPCRRHYDFWYLVECERLDFHFDKDEFHAAGWFSTTEAPAKCTRVQYVPILKSIGSYLQSR